jgi:hypothetical protein
MGSYFYQLCEIKTVKQPRSFAGFVVLNCRFAAKKEGGGDFCGFAARKKEKENKKCRMVGGRLGAGGGPNACISSLFSISIRYQN